MFARALASIALGAAILAGCEGSCASDPAACGGCAQRCLPWLECIDGRCGCPTGTVECGTACVDVSSDGAHCGACDRACAMGATCSGGVCACESGSAECDGACVRVVDDPERCGACDVACGRGQACEAGSCRCPDPSLEVCPAGCVDLSSSTESCGACGRACPAGGACVGGACACPAGQITCDDVCVDRMTHPQNCGGCGVVCAAGLLCRGGACGCGVDRTQCGSACFDTETDPMRCGSCTNVCGDSEICRAGRCIPGYRFHATHPSSGSMPSNPDWDGRVAVATDGAIYVAYTDGARDVDLVRYLADGTRAWTRTFTTTADRVGDVAAGADGSAVFAAAFTSTWIDPGGGRHTPVGSSDVAVVAVSADGTLRWQRFVGSAGLDSAHGVAVGDGRVLVSGRLSATFDFGGGPIFADTFGDAYVYELAEDDGAYVDANVYGRMGTEQPVFVALAPDGDIIVAGYSGAGVDFGGGPTGSTVAGFVARLAPDFAHRWSRAIRGQDVFGVAVDATGGVYVGGQVDRTTDFGDGVVLTVPSGNVAQFALALSGATGASRWVGGAAGRFAQRGRGPVVDADGNVWMGLSIYWSLGSYDALLRGWEPGGRTLYSRAFGGRGEDFISGLATAGDTLAVGGRFQGTASFGGGPVSSSGRDVFLMVLDL